ncbi:MAG: hypothetical protein HN350_18595 [Phycisphaerales bacterium]|jgi:hypothetical protein|nr:hypothetical protein [Phycisphaerales bacterium]
MRVTKQAVLVGLMLVVMFGANIAFGQSAKLPGGPGLMAYAPEDTVFFLERQGHTAIKKAFDASNLGKMAKDDAMNDFIHGTRVRIGELIMRDMFDLKNPVAVQAHQKTLHEVLKPFWYQPSAMVVTAAKEGPEFYFVCQTGEYQKTCKQSLEKLMSVGVAPLGTAGKRQGFVHNSSGIAWTGVAKAWNEFQLSNDPVKMPNELKGKDVFMAAWHGKTLCVALSLSAAERASALLAKPNPAKSILANESIARIAAKTHIKDWAFRWHLNLEPIFELAGDDMGPESMPGQMLARLGLDSIRGIGGTGGYLDNVYTRMTYADAPNSGGLFKHGGDYKKGLAMTPEGAAFSLSGQFNASWICDAVSVAMSEPPASVDPKRPENPMLTQIKALLVNSEGNGTVFLTSLQALAGGMMGRGGPPIGFVMDIKDRAKAVKALEAIVKLTGGGDPNAKPPKPYRKTKIIQAGGMMKMALTKDRLIIAMNQSALVAGIDTVLDDTGGLGKDSQAAKLVKLAGEGSAVFHLDMQQVVKLVWPFLVAEGQRVEERDRQSDFPFVSIPSAGKMARMLGPEIAVFKPDKGGLLLKSRGKIPLITKILPISPIAGGGLFFLMMR